jgi:serine protease inhibitor
MSASEGNGVVSGVGAWLLLAALLHGADGPARRELEAALRVTRGSAAPSVRRLWRIVSATEGVECAAGLWTNRDVAVEPSYAGAFPQFTIDTIPRDRSVLDRWASDRTAGLITRFPCDVNADTRLVAATALVAIADWERPFTDTSRGWSGSRELRPWLSRVDGDLAAAALLTSGSLTVSRVVCRTVGGFDVHLVAGGPDDSPGEVLGVGLASLDGDVATASGANLSVGDRGGCLVVEHAKSTGPDPQLMVSVPAFEVATDHDLLSDAQLFGLVAAQDTSRGHFPGLSKEPLAVQSAAQSALASFSATGFKAAAVTAVAMVRAALATRDTNVVRVDFDRPFGFIVVERVQQLALFAGWIADPVAPERAP